MSNTQQLINKMVREYEKLISRFIKFLEKEPYNKNMKTYQKGIDKMLAIQNVELNRVADTIVKELIPKVYEEGLERATKAVKQKANKAKEFSVKEFLKNKKEIDDTMSRSTKRHVQEVNTLIDQTSMALKTANYKFRKQVKQSIRKIAKEIESLEIDVGIQMKFLKERLAEDIKTNKNITKIEDNVKHIIKTAKNESQNMSMARYAMETGIDLVQMSSHSPTCKICQMYQGRVYSVSGKDKRFPSLFDTAFKSGYANIHPNCNHKIRIYTSSLKRREDIHGAIKKSNSPFNDQQTVKQKDRYDALQKKKRQLRVDRLLWERYKSRLGIEIVPSSFSKFKKVKDSEGKKWRNIENIYKLAGDSEKLLYYLHGKYYNTNNGIKKVEFDEEIANDQKIQEFAADMEKNVDSLVQAILSQLEKSSNKLDKDEKDSIENLVKNFPKMISSTKRSSTDKKKLIMKTIKEFVSLEKISGDKSDILRRISYAVDTGKAPKLERAIDYVLDIAYLEDMEQRLNIDKGVGGGGSKSWNTEEKKEQFELRVPSGYKTIDIEDYLKSVVEPPNIKDIPYRARRFTGVKNDNFWARDSSRKITESEGYKNLPDDIKEKYKHLFLEKMTPGGYPQYIADGNKDYYNSYGYKNRGLEEIEAPKHAPDYEYWGTDLESQIDEVYQKAKKEYYSQNTFTSMYDTVDNKNKDSVYFFDSTVSIGKIIGISFGSTIVADVENEFAAMYYHIGGGLMLGPKELSPVPFVAVSETSGIVDNLRGDEKNYENGFIDYSFIPFVGINGATSTAYFDKDKKKKEIVSQRGGGFQTNAGISLTLSNYDMVGLKKYNKEGSNTSIPPKKTSKSKTRTKAVNRGTGKAHVPY